jgi:hypothetical protein
VNALRFSPRPELTFTESLCVALARSVLVQRRPLPIGVVLAAQAILRPPPASPYGPEWGSCSNCGADRELASLGSSGLCETCDWHARGRS